MPNPAEMTDPVTRASAEKALNYIGLDANTDLKDIPVDQVFIGLVLMLVRRFTCGSGCHERS